MVGWPVDRLKVALVGGSEESPVYTAGLAQVLVLASYIPRCHFDGIPFFEPLPNVAFGESVPRGT